MRTYIEQEKQREDLKNTITLLEQVLERKSQTTQILQDLQIVYNNEDILHYFIRVHDEAKKEVLYVTQIRYGSYNSELDERTVYSVINNLVRLLKRGISVRVIYPESPYLNFFSQIAACIQDERIRELYSDLVEIRICNTEHNFILVDEATCIFELEDQRDLTRPYVMIRIQDMFLNAQLREVFEKLWGTATPIQNA